MHYADADIYVQTPAVDNMPLSVLEAFASGIPVVSTEVGGVRAMLTPTCTACSPRPTTTRRSPNASAGLLEEPGLGGRLADAARRETDAYVWDAVRDRWATTYARLARRRRGGRRDRTRP